LLAAEKALLIRNNLAGMLRQPMPRLPQLMLSYGLTGACQFQTLFSTSVFHEFSAQNCPQSSQVLAGVCSMGAKTAKAGTAGHANDDIS